MKHTAILSFPAAHPWRTIAGVALTVVIAIAGIAAVGLKTDNSIDVFLVEGDADYERFEDFRQRFGSNEILLLAVQDPQLLTTAGLERLDGLEAGLRAIDAQLVAAGTVKQAVIGTIRGPHSFPVVRELVAEGDTDALKRLPIVSGTFLVQNDHAPIGMLLTVLRSPLNGPDRTAFVGEVDTWLADQESPGTKIWAAGSPILNVNLDRASRGQSRTLFPFLFLVALVVLWVLSRSVRAALAMAATTIVTVPSAVCLLAVTGHSMNMITTTMPAVLMVLCFAASLHLYRAFADEDPAAVSDRVAADRARRHVMRPCFLASVATALGFLSLAISDLGPIRQMGVFCACGIAVSFLAAMTLLPALFALGAVPRRARKPGVEGATPCPLPPQRPSRVLPVTLVVFAICGVGLTRLDIESAAIRFLRRDHPVVQAWDHIQGSGAGIAPIEIMLRVPDATILEDPTTLAKIAAAVRDARAVEMISDAWSVPATLTLLDAELSAILAQDPRRASALAPMREQALAAVPAETPPAVRAGVALAPLLGALSGRTDPPPLIAGLPADALNGARGLVRTALSRSGAGAVVRIHLATVATEVSDFRQVMDDIDVVTQRLEASVPGSRVETTGLGPMLIRMQSYLIESQIKSLAGAGVLVMLILLIGLRSIRLALVGAVPNIAPLIVVFGVLGWLGVNLDVATVMVGAIALGIAVDDTTHVLSTYDRRLRRPVATRKALDHVWWPVLSTSLMSTAGFSVLAFSDFAPMMKFGIVTASAMALANLGDLVLLPALLLWFGPRPDRAEFVRISGAGGLLDRVLRRRRGGRLLLELGFSAWRAAERTLDDDPRGAGDLYREGMGHLDRYLDESGTKGSTASRDQTRATAIYYRALCRQGLDRLADQDGGPEATRIRAELAGFEDEFSDLPEVVVGALGVRLRAEIKTGDVAAGRATLARMEHRGADHRATVRGHLRIATALLRNEDDTLRAAAYRSYRLWLLAERPTRPEHWLKAGKGLETLDRLDDARDVYQAGLDVFAKDPPDNRPELLFRIRRRLARVTLRLGDLDAAAASYRHLVSDKTSMNPYYGDEEIKTRMEQLDRGEVNVADTEELEIP